MNIGNLAKIDVKGSMIYFPVGSEQLATKLGNINSDVHNYISNILQMKTRADIAILPKSIWLNQFGGQDYGSPVTPGDGKIYYGTSIPNSWHKIIKDNEDMKMPNFTMNMFIETISHEIGHLYSNELIGKKTELAMEQDYHNAKFEILWAFESFSQFIMYGYLYQNKSKYFQDWINLYSLIYHNEKNIVECKKLRDWGTKLIPLLQSDPEKALLNYFWFQAKLYLMCENIYNQFGNDFIVSMAHVFKRIEYPITHNSLLQTMENELPGISKIINIHD